MLSVVHYQNQNPSESEYFIDARGEIAHITDAPIQE